MKHFIFKNRIVINYVSALLLILMVPFIVSVCLLQYAVRFSVSQNEESSFLQLKQTQELVDRNLLFLRRTAMRIAQNRSLLELESYDSSSSEDIYRTTVLAAELAKEVGTHDFCEGFYVYARSADLIFFKGYRYSPQDFFRTYVKQGQYETWKRKLGEDCFDYYYTAVGEFSGLTENGIVEYRQSYPLGGNGKGTISFILDKGIFVQQNLEKQYRTNAVKLFIFNKNNELIYQTSEEHENVLQKYLSLADGYSHEGGALVCRTTSDTGNLRYILVDNGSHASQTANKIFLFSSIYAAAVLLGGGIYIYSASRKMARRSETIYEFLDEKNRSGKVFDWNSLLDGLKAMSRKNSRMDLLVSVKNDMDRNRLFINLLHDRSEYVERSKTALQEMGVDLNAADFMVVLGTFNIAPDEKPELVKYAIQNILGDLVDTANWYFIDYNWNRVMFLFTGNFGANFKEEATNICDVLAEFIRSILDIETEFDVGDICHSVEGIRVSVHKLLNRYDYKSLLRLSQNDRGETEGLRYGYLQEQENELMSMVMSGAADAAEEFVGRLITAHKRASSVLLRILVFNLLGTLFKCADRMNISGILENAELDTVFYSQDMDEIEKTVKHMFRQVCENAVGTEENRHLKALGLKLMNYVDANYQETDLSLKTLSSVYGITVSYVSKIFKEQIGCNFSDYLTTKRMERAKQLLEESELSISEIAQRTGYVDSSTFIKNFKRTTKMTPGAYRDTHKRN